MADNYYNPWVDAAQGMSSVGNSLSGLALGLAQQKYQQQMGQQQMALRMMEAQQQGQMMRKHGELYDAQTAHARANELLAGQKQKELEREGATREGIGNALGQAYGANAMLADLPEGQYRVDVDPVQQLDNSLGQALAGMGQVSNYRGITPEQVAQMFQVRNQRMQQLMALGGKPTANVTAGGTLVDNIRGGVVHQSPRTLGQGQVMVPGAGGERIAEGMPPRVGAMTDPRQQMIGSLGNILRRFDPDVSVLNQQNPVYNAAQAALLPLLQQLETNQVPQTTAQPQSSIPPAAQREVNKVYMTPKGELKWTGTGWVKP
jgi:hypothetical protein